MIEFKNTQGGNIELEGSIESEEDLRALQEVIGGSLSRRSPKGEATHLLFTAEVSTLKGTKALLVIKMGRGDSVSLIELLPAIGVLSGGSGGT